MSVGQGQGQRCSAGGTAAAARRSHGQMRLRLARARRRASASFLAFLAEQQQQLLEALEALDKQRRVREAWACARVGDLPLQLQLHVAERQAAELQQQQLAADTLRARLLSLAREAEAEASARLHPHLWDMLRQQGVGRELAKANALHVHALALHEEAEAERMQLAADNRRRQQWLHVLMEQEQQEGPAAPAAACPAGPTLIPAQALASLCAAPPAPAPAHCHQSYPPSPPPLRSSYRARAPAPIFTGSSAEAAVCHASWYCKAADVIRALYGVPAWPVRVPTLPTPPRTPPFSLMMMPYAIAASGAPGKCAAALAWQGRCAGTCCRAPPAAACTWRASRTQQAL